VPVELLRGWAGDSPFRFGTHLTRALKPDYTHVPRYAQRAIATLLAARVLPLIGFKHLQSNLEPDEPPIHVFALNYLPKSKVLRPALVTSMTRASALATMLAQRDGQVGLNPALISVLIDTLLHDPKPGEYNAPLRKEAVVEALRLLLGELPFPAYLRDVGTSMAPSQWEKLTAAPQEYDAS
jgi:hypothetical protein